MNEKNNSIFNSYIEPGKEFTKVRGIFSELEKHITGIRRLEERNSFKEYKAGELGKHPYYFNCSCVLDDGNIIVFKTDYYKDDEYRRVFGNKYCIDLKGFESFEEYMKSKGLVAGRVEEEDGKRWDYCRLEDENGECFALRYLGVFFV